MLRREAARAGLDVFAVTNHNMVFTARFAQWMASTSHGLSHASSSTPRESSGPIIITGQEITNPEFHLIAVGVKRTVNAGQPATVAIRTCTPIGSSDFHVSPALAACRTMVFAREATAAGVIEPIRSGRTVAIDQFGHRYGDASLIQLLDTVTLVDRPDVDPPVETLFWRRVSLVFTWFGIGGMLVTRGGGLTRCTRSLTQSTRRNSAILVATRFGTAM